MTSDIGTAIGEGMSEIDHGERMGIDDFATPGGKADHDTGPTPRYLKLARTLQDGIQTGAFEVGSLLPTEIALSGLHGVSRQTVRQAIGQLRQQGLVSARRGIGTRVEAQHTPKRFSYSALSATDLMEIASETEMTVERSDWIEARGSLATMLGCRANHRWLRLDCVRQVDGEPRPLAAVTVYIDARYVAALTVPTVIRSAIFVLIEKQSGEALSQIQQDIRATLLDGAVATRLDADPGSPALEITRRYFGAGRRLVLVSVNIMPSDRFFYSVAISQE